MNPINVSAYSAAASAFFALVSALATVVAVFIYRAQAREMREQTLQLAKSVEGSNLLKLIGDFLDKESMRAGRKRVARLGHEGTPFGNWTEQDKLCGEDVIRSFDLMGLMVMRHLLDKDLVLRTWGLRIIEMHNLTEPLLNELRIVNGRFYMDNFDWLDNEAKSFEGAHRRPIY